VTGVQTCALPILKSQYPKTHDLMKQIREAYDPKGLLNPGVKII
jgi:FAD/FMN-containing dehydrogenase